MLYEKNICGIEILPFFSNVVVFILADFIFPYREVRCLLKINNNPRFNLGNNT